MKKAILILEDLSMSAITKDRVYTSTKDSLKTLKVRKKLFHSEDLAVDYFHDNEEEIFNILNNVEFEYKKNTSSFDGSDWLNRLISHMEYIDIDKEKINCNTFSHRYWGSSFPVIFDFVVVALRVQYIKIKKKTASEIINGDEWSFTFSTYEDDLTSINYQKAKEHLNSKFKGIPISYSNDDIMQLTTNYLDNNVYHLAHREKVERNMMDLANEFSVYVRLDKPFISDKDVEDFILKFKEKRYKALL